jgi:hypothetical protein
MCSGCAYFPFILFVLVLDLGIVAGRLVDSGLKPSTLKTYASAQRGYIRFCEDHALVAVPTTNPTLLLYVAHLFARGLKGSSIRVYLAGVRNLHVTRAVPFPDYTPQLQLALRGAVNLSASPIRKLPITYDVLVDILEFLKGRHDAVMLKAVMTLAFFGCFRAGELCLPDRTHFDAKLHLTCGDLSFNEVESYITVTLKRSKTDKSNTGVGVHVGCSGGVVCAFCLLLSYRDSRADFSPSSPLFVDCFGTILCNSYFQNTTKLLLAAAGYDSSMYSGHSFRAGSATTAADVGFSDWELKMLGRWRSDAYNIYLRNPKVVNTFARRLALN